MARKSVPFTRKPGSTVSSSDEVEGVQAENVVQHPRHAAAQHPQNYLTVEKKTGGSFASLNYCGRAVYGAVYGLTYGVVFGALMVSTLIPGGRLIGQAMLDAGGEARKDFAGWSGRSNRKASLPA